MVVRLVREEAVAAAGIAVAEAMTEGVEVELKKLLVAVVEVEGADVAVG